MGFGPIKKLKQEDQAKIEEVTVVKGSDASVEVVPVVKTIDVNSPTSGSNHTDNMNRQAKDYENSQGIETVPESIVTVEVAVIVSAGTVDDDAIDLESTTVEIDENNPEWDSDVNAKNSMADSYNR